MRASKLLFPTVCVLLAFLAPGCASSSPAMVSVEEDVPVWELSDTELSQLPGDTPTLSYAVEFYEQPPYYIGSEPLTYTSIKVDYGFGMMEEIMAQFEDFTNLFIYESAFTLAGAQTYDLDGNLVAEIVITYFPDEINRNPEGKEYHYDADGNLIFTCTSEFSFATGEKISETDAQGEKETDYYFILPLGF